MEILKRIPEPLDEAVERFNQRYSEARWYFFDSRNERREYAKMHQNEENFAFPAELIVEAQFARQDYGNLKLWSLAHKVPRMIDVVILGRKLFSYERDEQLSSVPK